MRRVFVVFVFILCFCESVLAYPISPKPLRKLVIESKSIIVGHVIKVKKVEIKKKKWNDSYSQATIVIKEVLQGEIKSDTIKIKFEPNMVCPAPDMYYENTTVLAFVDFSNGEYKTHALSYGAKTMEQDEIDVYKLRIAEVQSILKNDNKVEQLKETVEWLVKCVENKSTQWEGVFELSPQSNFMSSYLIESQTNYKLLLSNEQKGRLKKTLFNSKELFYVDFGLIDLVYEGNEGEVDMLMVKGLEASVDEEYNWTALDYMNRLVHLNDCEETRKLIRDYDEIIMNYDKEKKGKEMILKFLSLIKVNLKN